MYQLHLPLSLPNLSFDELIQDFVTDSYISSKTFIQLIFTSFGFLGKFPKSLKIFATYYMDDRKYISSGNSIDFNYLTKRYAHNSGGRKSQTAPTNIYLLRIQPESSKYLSSTFGRFDIEEGNPLHMPEIELLLRSNDFQANPAIQFIIKFMRDPGLTLVELENHWI